MLLFTFLNQPLNASEHHNGGHGASQQRALREREEKSLDLAKVMTSMQFTPNRDDITRLADKINDSFGRKQNPALLIEIAQYIFANVNIADKSARNFVFLVDSLSEAQGGGGHDEKSDAEFKAFFESEALRIAPEYTDMEKFIHKLRSM